MVETILSSPIITEAILPFVLIFTVVYAILQKSGILGKDKQQIDALVALVVGLITITFANAVGIINDLLPFLAVSIVLILVFLILVAMVSTGKEGIELHPGFKWTIAILAFIAVFIAGLVVTGAWTWLANKFETSSGASWVTNIVFIIIILVAFVIVFLGDKKKDK
ncbi:hypothetical protein EXS72_01700 [Candidatus Pacearchaeota archaeon]|nr:hypothetical protein [Candidatus Pacearchaeota archaeon]